MVISVCVLDNYVLEILLSSRALVFFDIKPYFTLGDFYLLKNLDLLKNFTIDEGGICWGCGLSLSWDTVLKHSHK